ncbi:MAG TPA: SPOR domain-containing protein [Vicinamibacterales bacterium]|jgi:cell division septation protein DedD
MTDGPLPDGREFPLNGKPLVFLFMAAAVVSVVIFLCGVLVGRGVRAQVNAQAAAAPFGAPAGAGLVTPAGDPSATPDVPATATPAAGPASTSQPPLTYYDRLEAKTPPAEHLVTGGAAAATPASRAAMPDPPDAVEESDAQAPAAPAAASLPADPALAPSGGPGFAVQVAALRDRQEADAVAHRLVTKGYRAYVVPPASGGPAVFRVRVGKFNTRAQAQAAANRLRKEEQFKPWITR